MRHNKIIGWEGFLEVVEKVQKVSPWLSRQIAKGAPEWPFLYSGFEVREWSERQVSIHLSQSARNSLDGEISHGHLLLGGELALRLVLMRHAREFPFRHTVKTSKLEMHHAVDQSVDFRFQLPLEEWERIRVAMVNENRTNAEFLFQAYLADGRSAATVTFDVAFQLEKFLPA